MEGRGRKAKTGKRGGQESAGRKTREVGKPEAGKESKGTEGFGGGPSDTEETASPLFAGMMTTTMRIQGKSRNSECSSSPGPGRPGWAWAPWGPGSKDQGSGRVWCQVSLAEAEAGCLGGTVFGKTTAQGCTV